MTSPREPATTPEEALRCFRHTGDAGAAGDLFDLTSAELFRVALTLAPEASSAEDALQETYIAALEAVDRFEDGRPVVPWLLGILRRKVSRLHRDAGRRPDPARLPGARPPADPSDTAAAREEEARVHAAIEDLAEPYRSVALMRWRYGMEPAEIAHVKGEPPGTIRSLLHRAARKLEPALGALPSVIVVGAGGVGLELVRARVVSAARAIRPAPTTSATATAAAASGVGAASLLTGGLVMGKSMKLALGAAAVLLVAGGMAVMSGLGGSDPVDDVTRVAIETPDDPTEETSRKRVGETVEKEPEPVEQASGALPPPVDLDRCDRDLDVHGTVVRADGEPIPGASIEFLTYPWRRTSFLNTEGYDAAEPVTTRLTAEDGTFALRLRRGALVHLDVKADGFAPSRVPNVQAGERLHVTLVPLGEGAVHFTVRVVGADRNVVPNASVRVFTLAGQEPAVNRTVVSDDDGIAAFPGLPENVGVYLNVDADGHGDPSWIEHQIGDDAEQRKDVELPRGRTLTGRVTNAFTGAPIVGAKIGMNWVQNKAVFSDDDGHYVLPGWTAKGTREIAITAEGYGRQKFEVGDRETIDAALRPGDSVTGRLVTPEGKPVGGAHVGVVGSDHSGTTQVTSFGHCISEPNGAFLVTSLRRDLPHSLIVTAEGHGRTLTDFDPHPGAAGEIDLGDVVVHPARAIEGVVENSDGSPLSRVTVILNGSNADRGRLRSGAPLDFFYGNTEQRVTDDQGRFRFPDLADGEYVVKVRPDGAPEQRTTVSLRGRDVLDARITLDLGHLLTVRVLGPDGEPIPNMHVSQMSGGTTNVRTDADGIAKLTLPSGRSMQVYVFPLGSVDPELVTPPAQMITEDQDEATFQFKRGKLVRVRLLDPGGDPIVGATVEMRRGGDVVRGGRTDEEGRVVVNVPDEGPVDVTVSPNKMVREGRIHRMELLPFTGSAKNVRPGAAEETVIRCVAVKYESELTVRVEGPDGEAVDGAHVFVTDPAMPGQGAQTTGSDGRVRLTNLPTRKITVAAMLTSDKLPEGWMPPRAESTDPDGPELVLRYRRAAFVTGAVTMPDGNAAKQAIVSATRGTQSISAVQCDADGRFRLIVASDEEPFTVKATAASGGGAWIHDTTNDVRPGDDLRLSLKATDE